LHAPFRRAVEGQHRTPAGYAVTSPHPDQGLIPPPYQWRSLRWWPHCAPVACFGRYDKLARLMTASCPSVNDTPRASAVRIRAIAGAVIGTFTSPWCWWQVPAHGVTAAGRGAGQDALAAEGASAPSFVTRQFSEVSAADWLRRPSVLTVGRRSAWSDHRCRRPKTCTIAAIRLAGTTWVVVGYL
jgi:hypothetical protein